MLTWSRFNLVLKMALRSLWAHRTKSLIVGSLMTFGTLLVVGGTALFDSIERSMSNSVIESMSGHLQIYSAHAKDDLSIYGGMSMSDLDYGEIEHYGKLQEVVQGVAGVRALVPMGINVATMRRGSELDRVVNELRRAYAYHRDDVRIEGEDTPSKPEELRPRLDRLLNLLVKDLTNRIELTAGERKEELKENLAHVMTVLDDDFWLKMEVDSESQFQFLETKVVPAGGDGRLMYMRYIGTDLTKFQTEFKLFDLKKGEKVPEGRRGILINQKYADRRLKLLAARLLDRLFRARTNGIQIEGDGKLESRARRLKTQAGSISLKLNPKDVEVILPKLQDFLQSEDDDFDALLTRVLTVDDNNIESRHTFFYDHLAPHLELYPFEIGDVVTIRAWTKSGYTRSANVKVYGTFDFKGLEESDITGAANLLDIMTFRELYGQMSEEQKAELKAISAEVKVKNYDRKNLDDSVFGGMEEELIDTQNDTGFSEFEGVDIKRTRRAVEDLPLFSQDEIDDGLALSAAVVLEDGESIEAAKTRIQGAIDEAGLPYQVVTWKEASGWLGWMITLVWGVLYVAIGIIFIVALVIINNSMLMATLERVREIGTMRAIGAQRGFVLQMLAAETFMLCLVAGGVGILVSIGLLSWAQVSGIPAPNDFFIFLFSGPELRPDFEVRHLVTGFLVILFVSSLATLWPARVATRVAPIEAMREGD